ncbi:MAG TPA: sigma 54-interacting transcriptional regulator, partial [Candidatus Polarisedimenticolia bacterium]|nr:sigma 54-interacting transcriptional regulator [Candidatus Polarisedimenticolia bacterium]
DLQWVDAGTLSLLEPLLTSPDVRCLLIIGAFRDNEVDEAHPLARTLGTLRAAGARLDSITLGALGMGDMLQFASDTLRSEPAEVEPLARLVLEKTGGNPFFVIQFLRTLHEDRLVHFDESRRQWGFKIEEIRGAPLTDNVVDLMTRKIRRLPDDTRRVLTLAACIGNQFEAQVLATACELTAEEAIARVAPAVEDGLILPLRRDYEPEGESPAGEPAAPQAAFAFLHDRVQQAAYALIPEADRRLVHLTVGRLLLARRARADAADDRIFDVVHHLNLGSELIADPEEKLNLARLNLAAGRKARTSAAFLEALRHFRSGCALLDGLSCEGEEAWRTHYSLSFELNMHAAECEYLCGNFQEADRYFGLMLSRARTRLDKALVHCLRTLQYENLSLYPDAVRAAREGLELFDLALPDTTDAQAAALDEEIAGIERRLQDRSIASLEELPWMQDEDLRALMRLLTIAWAPAYISGGSLLSRLISALLVRLSLDHGVTEESAYGYVTHAISVGPIGGDYRSAYEWGRLALAVTERFEDSRLKAKIHQQFHAHVTLWRRPLASCIPHAREACRSGLEIGDLIYAGYGAFTESWPAILISRDLERFVRDISPSLALLHKIRRNSLVEAQRDILGFARALQGLTRHRLSFSHEGFVEEEFLRRFEGQPFFTTYHHVLKLYLCLLLEEGREALATAPLAREAVAALEGTLWPVFLDFVEGIALAQFRDEGRAEAIPAELVRSCDRMSRLAENCPDNFLCWSLMLQAERARLEKRDREAQRLYDEAIRYARETESLQNEALANELCARYWRGAGNERIATLYLKVAHSLYELWGASAKTRDLEHRYPDLLAGDESGAAAPTASGSMAEAGAPAIETEPAFLDISTFAKAANAIAVEIFLDDLLRKLVRIAIENAGAQRGLFLQEKDGRLVIEAEGSVDADEIRLPRSAPLDEGAALCRAVVHYARKTGQSVVVADASADDRFASDPYVAAARPRSILCVPVVHQGRLGGLLYLENNLSADAFTSDRVRVMQILSAQAAISLENSRLYEDMRQEVSLRRKAETDLRAALAELEKLKNRLQAENVYLQEEIRREHNFEELVGSSPALLDLLEKVERVAPTDTTVLVYGETGTGKELLARALHNRSARRQRPLAKVNCGAIPAGLMESELFGHVKGAFTGALERRVGRFELADGGTLFLDEVGELPLETQVKLLRVLQEREFEPVGSNRTVRVDVRVIAATNRDLEQAVRDGRFRADLYYRLSVFPLKVPALRERASDVPQLVMYFLARFARKLGRRVDTVPRATMDRLARYAWPGNIRELQNIIERAVILSPGSSLELGDDLLPVAAEAPARLSVTLPAVPESIHPASGSPPEVAQAAPPASLREVEKLHILEALSRTNWVIEGPRGAALILSLHPNTLRSRMKKLGIRR